MASHEDKQKAAGTGDQPGVVIIQIDGLSFHQCQSAMDKGEMPFLRSLIQQGQYRLSLLYSGLPSTTAIVQGELFYGIKQSVPAYRFWDRNAHKEFRMSEGDAAITIEKRLTEQGEGLFKGGSSYSNHYSGGAREFHFCAVSLTHERIWKEFDPYEFWHFVVTQTFSFLRMIVLVLWEIPAGLLDSSRWILGGGRVVKELTFVLTRTLICVWLREMITLSVCRDIRKGLAAIHVNFLGYDEQSHHRGPSSGFAHRSLRHIDNAIKKIYRAAIRSRGRNYDVWIYSDHGQGTMIPYPAACGRTIEAAVGEVLRGFNIKTHSITGNDRYSRSYDRLGYINPKLTRRHTEVVDGQQAVITADGTLGNIYLPHPLSKKELELVALKLVIDARIPAVAVAQGVGHIKVWTQAGEFMLPHQAEEFFGKGHPFLKEVTEDLISLCHHHLSGDLMIMGWQKDGQNWTFSYDRGEHAGPSVEETSAFALIPYDVLPAEERLPFMRIVHLHQAALRLLKRAPALKTDPVVDAADHKRRGSRTVRLMTYNVHGCLGMDGKVSPERIARVISRHEPDIVALQELDFQRPRSGGQDQAHIIARHLEMFYHFHPSMQIAEEQYGDGVFSRFPIHLKKAGSLPALFRRLILEPRGALWVDIDVDGAHLQLINTHLSLLQKENLLQGTALLGKEWLSHPECRGPVILCGDLNAMPSSALCRKVKRLFHDAQESVTHYKPRATFPSRYPVGRIDHIFVNGDIEVVASRVPGGDLNKIASDHLPLIIDIKIKT